MNVRNSNIELLRLLLMAFVVLLHFNNDAMGGAFVHVRNLPIDNFALHFFESLGICAVNCFMIVSGFFLYTNSKIKFGKVLDILLIVIFYRYFDYFFHVALGSDVLSLKRIVAYFFPDNYFAIFYLICYIFSPYVSRVFRELSDKQADFLTAAICILFVIVPTCLDMAIDLHVFTPGFLSPIGLNGNGAGYTIVQFMVCMSLGMWIRKRNIQVKTFALWAIYLVSSLILTIGIKKFPSLYNYCSVLTVVNAICLFLLFLKIDFQSKDINYAAKSCFAIFCIHTRGFAAELWRQYFVTEEHLSSGLVTTLLWTFISIFAMFFSCLILSIIMRFVFGKLKDTICGKLPVVNCEE